MVERDAPSPLRPDRRGLYHPGSEAEVVDLVLHARRHGDAIRVVGSGRSEAGSIHTDATLAGRPFEGIELRLDKLRAVTFDDDRGEVTAQAGCRVSHDPRDPTGSSVVEEGLLWQLDQHGLALPVLTGGSCQTVGGYLGGGSDGGSLDHAIGDVIVGFRLVDGLGRIHDVRRGDPLFYAVGVSLGLLGIVTAVTFAPVPRFDIVGEEWGRPADRAGLGLAEGHERELVDFLRAHPYARINWWPQPGLRRAVAWTARPMRPDEYVGAAVDASGALVRAPYREVPEVLGSPVPAQVAGGAVLTFLGQAPHVYRLVAGTSRGAQRVEGALRSLGRRTLKPLLLSPFVTSEAQSPQRFRDTWWQGLPMDAQIDERLMPVRFTELWFPLSRAEDVVARLRERYARGRDDATGRFITELYGGKQSPFWLSPANGEDQLRVNVFWHKYDHGDPTESHFRRLWSDLEPLRPRYHWGKALPGPDVVTPAGWRLRYAHLADFLDLRADLDPDQLFVSTYWRARLGIPAPSHAGADVIPPVPVTHTPPAERAAAPRPWPLLFRVGPATAAFDEDAEQVIHNRVVVEADIEEAFRVATQPEHGDEWISHFRGVDWLTEPIQGVGSACVETFDFMSFRMRTVLSEPPYRQVGSIEACTLPLASKMTSEWRFYPVAKGRTLVLWWIRYTPLPWVEPIHPVIRPFFDHLFRTSTAGLKLYLDAR